MKPILKVVEGKRDLTKFIHFPEKLYKNDKWWVPALISDEYNTLQASKNPAFDYCEAKLWLALDEKGNVVGRVAGIINHEANKCWNEQTARFGWIDFIEDQEVLDTMLAEVEKWAVDKGMVKLKGPLGFTDLDKEGLLVEGFEQLSPFTCIYNFPYYGPMLEKAGFTKDADWTQRIVTVPDEFPRMMKLADAIAERAGVHVVQIKNKKELRKEADYLFRKVYNETFAPLYEFAPVNDRQIDQYINSYITILDKDFISIIHDKDERIVAFAITVPSLSKAVQKAKGRLFPFGIFPILKALHRNDTLEALMIGIHPDYQSKGLQVLLFKQIHENVIRRGDIKTMIMNPQLEENVKVQMIFDEYNPQPYMRRRSYFKELK
ncbi:MAG: N-acetyltransferase [Candidatus Cryptobacteroides sp.]